MTFPLLHAAAEVPLALTAATHTLNVDFFFSATLRAADVEPTLAVLVTFLFRLVLPFRVTL